LLHDHDLDYIPLIYTEGKDHTAEFKRLVVLASIFKPKKVIAHAGRDLWSFEKQVKFFEEALLVEKEFAFLCSRTHRRRRFSRQ